MNTQSLLFDNQQEIPEWLYVRLMNSLKMDFEQVPTRQTTAEPQQQVVNNAPSGQRSELDEWLASLEPPPRQKRRFIMRKKNELLEDIRRECGYVSYLTMKDKMYAEIRQFCQLRGIPLNKENPDA